MTGALLALGAALLVGCPTTTTTTVLTCTVDAELGAAEGAPGDVIVVSGGPFSERIDTTVRVAGFEAEVTDVTRTECGLCDECIEDLACARCGSCEGCADFCAPCVQTTTFVVPDVPPGLTTMVLVNRWGATDVLPFLVLGDGGDTDDTDTDAPDTDAPDTDTGIPDTDGDTDGGVDTDTGAPGDTDTDTPPESRSRRAARASRAVSGPAADFLVCPPA